MISIIWTDLAIDDFSENIYYLEKEWTEKEVLRFNKKVNEVIDKLSKGNIQFKSTDYKNVFQVVILKQITLFYELDKNNIILLRFWNNYQDLSKFKL